MRSSKQKRSGHWTTMTTAQKSKQKHCKKILRPIWCWLPAQSCDLAKSTMTRALVITMNVPNHLLMHWQIKNVKCKITYQDKSAKKNNFTRKNRDNFAPSTCQNLLRFTTPKSNIQNLFETIVFLSDLSPNIVLPCHLLLLTHSLRTVVETWFMWVWLMSKAYLIFVTGTV